MSAAAAAALPLVIGLIVLFGFVRGVPVFACFREGAKQGLDTALDLLPTLVGLVVAVSMARASGLLELAAGLLAPLCRGLGFSPELAPLMLLRPISGSGAMTYARELMARFGPDSETGRMAAVLAASTETTFYAVAVYFAGLGYKRLRWTLPAALLGDLAAAALTVATVKLMGG